MEKRQKLQGKNRIKNNVTEPDKNGIIAKIERGKTYKTIHNYKTYNKRIIEKILSTK